MKYNDWVEMHMGVMSWGLFVYEGGIGGGVNELIIILFII